MRQRRLLQVEGDGRGHVPAEGQALEHERHDDEMISWVVIHVDEPKSGAARQREEGGGGGGGMERTL